MPKHWLTSLVAAAVLAVPAAAQQAAVVVTGAETPALQAEIVADGLDHPWALAFLPDGRMIVTERPGTLRIIGEDGTPGPPIGNAPEVVARGQGGLMDIALDPDFAETGRLYLSYSEPPEPAGIQRGTGTAVAAAVLTLDGEGGLLEHRQVIFRMSRFTIANLHFGSRIVIAPDGMLLITIGDRGQMHRAQDLDDHAGAVVRIAPNGAVPSDNPFVGIDGVRPELHSIGHRNIQGAAIRPEDGSYWVADHGPRGGDEINLVTPGLNYGWPAVTHGVDYTGVPIAPAEAAGFEPPLHVWVPSIAPSGLAFYEGGLFTDWQGDLLVGALAGRMLVRLEMDGDTIVAEHRLLQDQVGRIRDVRVGPDGAIYLAIDASPGQIVRVTPAE